MKRNFFFFIFNSFIVNWQKDNKIKYTKVTKMETAYMLVYVQKIKEKKLLSELTIDDIPKNIQEQYQENKKLTQ